MACPLRMRVCRRLQVAMAKEDRTSLAVPTQRGGGQHEARVADIAALSARRLLLVWGHSNVPFAQSNRHFRLMAVAPSGRPPISAGLLELPSEERCPGTETLRVQTENDRRKANGCPRIKSPDLGRFKGIFPSPHPRKSKANNGGIRDEKTFMATVAVGRRNPHSERRRLRRLSVFVEHGGSSANDIRRHRAA